MAYNKFTLAKVKKQFNLTTEANLALFEQVEVIAISPFLQDILHQYTPLAIAMNTEKARSEFIIAPILAEFQKISQGQISFFSGLTFDVEAKLNLKGVCDFIISNSSEQYNLTCPVVTIVEAKNDNIPKGLGQCIATMVAARLFNEREGITLPCIYGAVTTGTEWKFLKLVGQVVYIDRDEYYLRDVGKIMGILSYMVKS